MATIRVKGTVIFSNLTVVDDFSNKFGMTIQIAPEAAIDLENLSPNPVPVRSKEYQGEAQQQVSFKTKYQLKSTAMVQRDKSPLWPTVTSLDDEGNEVTTIMKTEVPRGSQVLLVAKSRPWTFGGKSGTAWDLAGIQLIEEAEADLGFDDYSEGEEEEGEY